MIHLTILHTNDMHGRIPQLARIATAARQIRGEVEAAGGYCVLWDAGDAEDTVLIESSVTKGGAVMAVLHAAGYDQSALGNASPLRYGPQVVRMLAERFGRPLLCANMTAANGWVVAGLAPYIVQSFGEHRVALIGLTAPMFGAYAAFGTTVADPPAVLPALLARVRALGARTVVVLSHMGSEADRRTAEQVAGIDLIVGGHDHVVLDPPLRVNDTLIAQAGDYGRFLGRLDLELDPATGKIASHRAALIPIGEEIPPDPDTLAAFEIERARAQEIMQRVIGELRVPIEFSEDRECAAGNLLADALLERVPDAQVALVMAGHWTLGLEAGPLTLGALNAANRSPANPARLELTGEQILQFLRAALRPENAARRLPVLRGTAVGLPHVAGIRVRRDRALLDQLEATVAGEPLQPGARYVVAGTDLEFYDFMGYLPVPQDQIRFEVPTIIPEVLEDYIARHSPLDAPDGGRIATAGPA